MKRTSLAVFEKTATGWGAFSLDFPNTGGLGETLDETRKSLLEGIAYVMDGTEERQRVLSTPPCTSIDFSEFDPTHEGHYVIEWLTIDVPSAEKAEAAAA